MEDVHGLFASEQSDDSQDLRIVLLGVCGAGKSSTGNAILGREAFKESRTRESEKQRGRVEDRNISIIDTPGFFNTDLTDEELKKEMMKSLYLSDPGPHVFLLLINLETFEMDERNIVEEIQENFGAQAFKFTIVLFTGRERIPNRKWMLYMLSTKFQKLVSHFRGQHHAINSKNEIDQAYITELLQKIDKTVKQNNHQHYINEIYSMSRTKSIRIKTKQEEEKSYERKEPDMKQRQEKIARETLTTHSVMEERTTPTVTEEVKEIIRDNKTQEEENTYREEKQEKETRQEGAKVMSETFGMESATEKRTTHTVKEKNVSFVSHVRQTMNTTLIYENLNNNSLDGFQDFSDERMRDKNAVKTPEKSWGMSHKKTYQILSEEDLRIVLVGKTGSGKSSTGNTIIGNFKFDKGISSKSVTRHCQRKETTVEGKPISVIDTPGMFDVSMTEEELKSEIEKCVYMSAPGPHVFLLVIRLDVRFTDEEKNTVKWIQENFGKDAARYTIILFTHVDALKGKSLDEYIKENPDQQALFNSCSGRFHSFNNEDMENRSQVTELLEKIKKMVEENGGQHYTNDMYKQAQEKIEHEKFMQNIKDYGKTALTAIAGGTVVAAAAVGTIVMAKKKMGL